MLKLVEKVVSICKRWRNQKMVWNNFDVVNWKNDGILLQTEKHESGRIRATTLI